MANYNEILGHESIIEYMKGAGRTGQISHAYLFSGPDKSGKRMLANAFAKAITDAHSKIHRCAKCCNLTDEELKERALSGINLSTYKTQLEEKGYSCK